MLLIGLEEAGGPGSGRGGEIRRLASAFRRARTPNIVHYRTVVSMPGSQPKTPPGPPPLSTNPLTVYRHYRAFGADPIGFVGRRFEAFGDFYRVADRLFVTRHPDIIHEVLVTRSSAFTKRQDLRRYLGDGLVNSDGDMWRRQRRRIQPAFSRARLEAYAQVFARRVEAMLDRWRSLEEVDVGEEMKRLTLEIVVETLFASELNGETREVAQCVEWAQEAMATPLPPWVPTRARIRGDRALKVLRRRLSRMIAERRQRPGEDLLSQLIMATDEDGDTMAPNGTLPAQPNRGLPGAPRASDDERLLQDEIVTLFVAGHETTSLALTWALHLVSRHKDVWARWVSELDGHLSRTTSIEDISSLPVTAQVWNEALRLYPPAYALPRRVTASVDLGGYPVPEGAEVVIWIYHLHHDSRWFSEPESFRPERFEASSGLIHHPKAFVPFGAGSRTCIGRHFADLEGKILLSSIGRRYEMIPCDHRAVAPRPRITLGPARPLRMRLRRRD